MSEGHARDPNIQPEEVQSSEQPEMLQPEGQNMSQLQPHQPHQPHQPQPEVQEPTPTFANLTQTYPAAWTYSSLFWVPTCAWVDYQGWPFFIGGTYAYRIQNLFELEGQ